MRESEPLSEWTNAKGRLLVAWRQASPITPPWTTATATASGPVAATIASIPARTRPANDSADSPPGMMSQRSSSNARFTIGSPLASRIRYSPPSQSPSRTSARSSITVTRDPSPAASGAAVIAVR